MRTSIFRWKSNCQGQQKVGIGHWTLVMEGGKSVLESGTSELESGATDLECIIEMETTKEAEGLRSFFQNDFSDLIKNK